MEDTPQNAQFYGRSIRTGWRLPFRGRGCDCSQVAPIRAAFTEVEMPASGRGDGASPIVAETERQISDAEWEDIK